MSVTFYNHRRRMAAIKAAKAAEVTPEGSKPLEEMTVAELKEYAAANDIDLNGAKNKTEIYNAILESEKTPVNDDENGEPEGNTPDGENGESGENDSAETKPEGSKE